MRKYGVPLMRLILCLFLAITSLLPSAAFAADGDPLPVKPKVAVIDEVKWVQVYTPQELMYISQHQGENIEPGGGSAYLQASIMIMNDIDIGIYKNTAWIPLGASVSGPGLTAENHR